MNDVSYVWRLNSLRYYAMFTGSDWSFCSALIFRVKQWKSSLLLDCLTLQMKALSSFEIAVTIFWATWHNVPEGLNLQQHMCDDLISCISYLCTCWKVFCFYFQCLCHFRLKTCKWLWLAFKLVVHKSHITEWENRSNTYMPCVLSLEVLKCK